MKYRIDILHPLIVAKRWGEFMPFLYKVIELGCGEITEESIKGRALSGNSLFVTITSESDELVGVITMEVVTYDSGLRSLLIPIVGGTVLEECQDQFLDFAKDIAKELNCSELRGIAARKGWMRKLKDSGWHENHVIITCPLEVI